MSSIILIPIIFFLIIKGSYYFFLLLIITFFISTYEWQMLGKKKPYYIFGFIFLIFSFYTIYKLRMDQDNSFTYFLVVVLICILTDIGGYFFGKIFKGPKLTSYSPNKTISGSIGSYLLAFTLIPILIYIKILNEKNIIFLFIFIIIISTVSQIGDIIISYFKRKSNIKDTGKLIPGHGGILDRIDGMLFALPFSYLLDLFNLFIIFE